MAAITVEVDGMTFDGDETAQSRVARAITAADASGWIRPEWVLADNTVATVTKAQLQQAPDESHARHVRAVDGAWRGEG